MESAPIHESGPDPLEILPMRPSHIDEVLEIERDSFSNPWHRSDFEYALERNGAYTAVARRSGELAGYLVGFLVRGEFHLASLAVGAKWRRRGIARALLSKALEWVRERGGRLVTLEVRMSNARAQALYEKAGFQRVAIREGYYSRPSEDAYVMILALEENPWG